ncbi:hypothetical protein BaRGS_00006059, partial [Batillaria attramentaria]
MLLTVFESALRVACLLLTAGPDCENRRSPQSHLVPDQADLPAVRGVSAVK